MPHYKKLAGEKCCLSPCAANDAAKWAEWDNDLEVALPLGDEACTPDSPTQSFAMKYGGIRVSG